MFYKLVRPELNKLGGWEHITSGEFDGVTFQYRGTADELVANAESRVKDHHEWFTNCSNVSARVKSASVLMLMTFPSGVKGARWFFKDCFDEIKPRVLLPSFL